MTVKASELYGVRANRRAQAWLAHIRKHANKDGIWHSNERSRAGLPDAEFLSDDTRQRFLLRMVREGQLIKHGRARFGIKG